MNQACKAAVVGGGASGLAAALAAARRMRENGGDPAAITVLERLDRVGKKLLVTGNGRCNLTNSRMSAGRYRSSGASLLGGFLREPGEILAFFRENGLLCGEEDGGRIYPACRQASMVLDTLRCELEYHGVTVLCGFSAESVTFSGGAFTLISADGRRLTAQRVILSAGGRAAPRLGTDGSGEALAASFGHTAAAAYPCLVPLRAVPVRAQSAREESFSGLKGVRARCRVRLLSGNEAIAEDTGEIQFTEYGLSGIPAFQLSCALRPGVTPCRVLLDMFPDWEYGDMRAYLSSRQQDGRYATLENFLLGMLHKKLAWAILKSAGLSPLSRRAETLRAGELDVLARALKAWPFEVTGTLGWDQAQVSGGGVVLSEVDAKTLESRRRRSLYLTGELLDAAGECGGYNLHWAFGTGIRAGMACADSLL